MKQVAVLLVCIATLFCVFGARSVSAKVEADPATLAVRVANQLFSANNSKVFFNWEYGGAIIVEGLWDFAKLFNLPNIVPELDKVLDGFINSPNGNGYKLLHNISIPFGGAVGDTVGLFPIAYLGRVKYKQGSPGYDNTTDLKIAQIVASHYLQGWPIVLPDGTFARTSGWSGQPAGRQFLWCDDQFMGLTVLSRIASIYKVSAYADRAANMQVTYSMHMLDTKDEIFWHGVNGANGDKSCCKWGRANGWVMMSHVEVLLALTESFPNHPLFPAVLALFQKHSVGLQSLQDSDDGRWHQVLTEKSTFLETSCTSMFLWSIITGVQHGWLDKKVFSHTIEKAWAGLQKVIQTSGVVDGISEGTGIGTTIAYYNGRSTAYPASGPGLGSVLRAISAYQRYQNAQQPSVVINK